MLRALVVAAAIALTAPAAQAASPPVDRSAAIDLWRAIERDSAVAAGWTGSVGGCVTGDESPASRAATLRTINALRGLAGLAPVALDPLRNRQALAAALMMRAAGELSHEPDRSWPCYSAEGAEGASTSNLYLGVSGAAAMVGYVEDAGVPSLGHRSWLLDPRATVFGTGSTGASNALSVVGGALPLTAVTAVAWPPGGWVPWPLVFDDWSVEVRSPAFAEVEMAAARVHVSVDGRPARVSAVTPQVELLKWRVDLPRTARAADHRFDVEVTGALAGAQPLPLRWSFTAVALPDARVRILAKPRVRRVGRGRLVVRFRTQNARRAGVHWTRGGRVIRGAGGRVHRITRRDRGKLLRAHVTALGPDRSRVRRSSNAIRIRR